MNKLEWLRLLVEKRSGEICYEPDDPALIDMVTEVDQQALPQLLDLAEAAKTHAELQTPETLLFLEDALRPLLEATQQSEQGWEVDGD